MCGFVGVIGNDGAAPAIALGLQTIQHRGQDAAGIGTLAGGRYFVHKDLGLVSSALPASVVGGLPGNAGIGHVRYPTVGTGTREDAQPFFTRRPGLLVAHNGNVTNFRELELELCRSGMRVQSQCDAEPIMLVLADELAGRRSYVHTVDDIEAAVRNVMKRVRGGFAALALLEVDGSNALIAFRDPHGIRPAVYGRGPRGAWMVASESVALDVLGFELMGHVPPGAVMVFRADREPEVRHVVTGSPRHCVFERIYFARPDSVTDEGRVNAVRWELGYRLADEWAAKGLAADVVVAIPDTSRPAAMAISERLGLPDREGFIKNRYSGRTFIMPHQAARDAALRLKLNPIREVFEGKRVLLVDDSIVRGSTMRRIVRMVRALGPAEIHLAIFSPPVRFPCFYGIDMPSEDELVASALAPNQVEATLAERFGVDTVTYLSTGGLRAVAGTRACDACFTGDYPVEVSEDEREAIRAWSRERTAG